MNDGCLEVIWVDFSWMNGNIFGFNLINLFIKDIVSVLVNGYVIIWFVVDNLGICSWSLNYNCFFCYNLVCISKLILGSFCNMINFNLMLICFDE